MSAVEPEGLPEAAPEPEATPPAEPAPQFAPQDPRAQEVLDKYGGDVEKALSAAAEAQSLIGRQSSELGELRQMREYYDQQQQQASAQQIASYADEDPQQATMAALQQFGRGSVPYEQALSAWGDMDPFRATRFDNQAGMWEMQQQIQPQLQQQGLAQAMNQMVAKYPDLPEYGEAIMREAENSPVISALQAQGQDVSAGVLETLYLAAKGRQGLAQTQTQAHDSAVAREQKLSGGSASATAARPGEPPPATEEDAFRAEYQRVAREMGLMPDE